MYIAYQVMLYNDPHNNAVYIIEPQHEISNNALYATS